MKERYLPNKISSILGRLGCKKTIDRMESERRVASLGNQITQQIDMITERYKKEICTTVHHILKEQLK